MPSPRFELIEERRAIIDRRSVADRIAADPGSSSAMLAEALAAGRAEIEQRLIAQPADRKSVV